MRLARWLGIVCVGLATASALLAEPTTAPTTTTAPAMAEFVSPEFRFRLKYPSDWIVPEHPVNGEVFSVRTPPISESDSRFGVVGLRIDNGPEGRSDNATMMDLSGSIAGYVFKSGGQHVTIKPDVVGGTMSARRIRFETEQPSGKIETMYVVTVKKRIAYVFNVAAPAEKFDAMLPQVEAVLKSFEVLD
jgi:hypothetical protein